MMRNDIAHKHNTPARLIAIGGYSASGKTTLARSLAEYMDAVHLDSDENRKKLWGVAPHERLPPEAYRSEVTQQLITLMQEMTLTHLAEGRTVVVSTLFELPERRVRQEMIAQQAGVDLIGLWLMVDADVLRNRIAARANSVSDAGIDILERQLSFGHGYIMAPWKTIDGNGDEESVFAEILKIVTA